MRCSDGIQNFDETGIDCGGNSCNTICAPYPNEIKGEVLWRTHLTSNKEYYLSGPLLVRDGGILEISAGTTIKVVPNTNAYIAVMPGAKLWVWGTAEKPVLITSSATTPKPGDWGGIIMMGKAPTVYSEQPRTHLGNYFYGGADINDSSGQLEYLKVEYAGSLYQDGINPDIYYNGVSLYGVGQNTTIDYVHVTQSLGAGFGFYGGNVKASHILSTQNLDHAFTLKEGWFGKGENWYGANVANHGILIDYSEGPEPVSNSFMLNDIQLKGPLGGAAFGFYNTNIKGVVKKVSISNIALGIFGLPGALEAIDNTEFSISHWSFVQKPTTFKWGETLNNPPAFISLSQENALTTDAFPTWGLPLQ